MLRWWRGYRLTFPSKGLEAVCSTLLRGYHLIFSLVSGCPEVVARISPYLSLGQRQCVEVVAGISPYLSLGRRQCVEVVAGISPYLSLGQRQCVEVVRGYHLTFPSVSGSVLR